MVVGAGVAVGAGVVAGVVGGVGVVGGAGVVAGSGAAGQSLPISCDTYWQSDGQLPHLVNVQVI